MSNLQIEIKSQKKIISQSEIDQEEFEFLKLNLIHSAKCRRTVFSNGFKVGSKGYKNCILSKGKKIND